MTVEKTPWDPVSRRIPRADGVGAVAATTPSTPTTPTTPLTATRGSGRVSAAAASSCGPLHDVNEDSHSAPIADATLYVVADGVGGGAMASTASRQLVAFLHAALDGRDADADLLRQTLRDADRHIAGLIAAQTAAAGAATVAMCWRSAASVDRWLLGWVGDCRAFRIAAGAGEAELLSADDTYARLGEPPPPGGSPDDPARMVGNGAVGDASTRSVELPPGALLLLCSDGVHRHVDAAQMAALMTASGTLAERCQRVVASARANGSHDDATALVVERSAKTRPPLRRWALGGLLLALTLAGGLRWMGGRSPAAAPATGVAGPAASTSSATRAAMPSTAASGNGAAPGLPVMPAARPGVPTVAPALAIGVSAPISGLQRSTNEAASSMAAGPRHPGAAVSGATAPGTAAGSTASAAGTGQVARSAAGSTGSHGVRAGASATGNGLPPRRGKSAEPPGSPWAAETTPAPQKRAASGSAPSAHRRAAADADASTLRDGTAAASSAAKAAIPGAASEPTAVDRPSARKNTP